jgi:hypothetical protein
MRVVRTIALRRQPVVLLWLPTGFDLLDAIAGALVARNLDASSMHFAAGQGARGIPVVSAICALDHSGFEPLRPMKVM